MSRHEWRKPYGALRFWLKANDTGHCWEWAGKVRPDGYGISKWNGRPTQAHRKAWILANGAIPSGLCVCHHCDNRKCVNPDHLFLGTHKENTADMIRKGRHARKGPAKLTPSQVLDVRNRLKGGEMQKDIAKELGLDRSTISRIATRSNWGTL